MGLWDTEQSTGLSESGLVWSSLFSAAGRDACMQLLQWQEHLRDSEQRRRCSACYREQLVFRVCAMLRVGRQESITCALMIRAEGWLCPILGSLC
jgi:hypothetical protein